MQEESKFDPVNRPEHYIYGPECIEAMVAVYGVEAVINFCICNAFKYYWRHDKKNRTEDLEKGLWYSMKGLRLLDEKSCPLDKETIQIYADRLFKLRWALNYISEEEE